MIISRSPLSRQLQDYRLTTAEILYHMPDHPGLLQTYVWQELDLAPRFPVLRKFLDFWSHNLDGKLHSVRVANLDLISPGHMRHVDALMTLQ
ncbi:usg protein [Niveispirillum cyanobacteriorum]|uniref:Usg family protein n=1 Tax=Niveispirillum cyanobacteriorum TaxID=1612173 RepID=A0A2K9NCP3_9PROT|nr:usg protein [Niveispirillum cyanobacteriorum]AUN30316.1 Usg family protein [Niveispirillum cyanobacteriorum]GGE55848.1 protein usg [Niveispirillum cyanobacteriorum]